MSIQRPALAFAFFNAVNFQVAMGAPMVLLAERLGASTAAVAWAYAFVFLLVPLQVVSTPVMSRLGYRRTVLLGWTARNVFLLPPLAVAWRAMTHGVSGWMAGVLIASVFGFTLIRSFSAGAFGPWLLSVLPAERRGRYFGSEQIALGAGSIAVLLASSGAVRAWGEFSGYLACIVVALAAGLLSTACIKRMPDGPRPQVIALRGALERTPRLLFTAGPFRRFVWTSCLHQSAVTGLPAFCLYYLLKSGAVAPGSALWMETLRFCGVMAGAWLVRRTLDAAGARRFLVASLAVFATASVFWVAYVLLAFDAGAVLPGVFLALGAGAAFWGPACMAHLPTVTPEEDRDLAVVIYTTATMFTSGVCTVLWGYALRATGEDGRPLLNTWAFAGYFAFIFVAMAVSRSWIGGLRFAKRGDEAERAMSQ